MSRRTIPRYSARDAARLVLAIEEIARRIVYRTYVGALEREEIELDICLGCGCLVTLDEVCPGCRARRQRKQAA